MQVILGWAKMEGGKGSLTINVPVSDEDNLLNRVVQFSVTPIEMMGQWGPFNKNQLIGKKASGHWVEAHPGEEYDIIGIYIGESMVLTANVSGGT